MLVGLLLFLVSLTVLADSLSRPDPPAAPPAPPAAHGPFPATGDAPPRPASPTHDVPRPRALSEETAPRNADAGPLPGTVSSPRQRRFPRIGYATAPDHPLIYCLCTLRI